mmetsp:Transcript_39491/g.106571  ORF Transcript_39491/g.106571 Transcript_39491/m.106571 type:complete len:221 (+) Transcript_39491:390-1052(+)
MLGLEPEGHHRVVLQDEGDEARVGVGDGAHGLGHLLGQIGLRPDHHRRRHPIALLHDRTVLGAREVGGLVERGTVVVEAVGLKNLGHVLVVHQQHLFVAAQRQASDLEDLSEHALLVLGRLHTERGHQDLFHGHRVVRQLAAELVRVAAELGVEHRKRACGRRVRGVGGRQHPGDLRHLAVGFGVVVRVVAERVGFAHGRARDDQDLSADATAARGCLVQ